MKKEDLEPVPAKFAVRHNEERLEEEWRSRKHETGMPLFRAHAAAYKREFLIAFSLNFLQVFFETSTPFLIKYFIEFVKSDWSVWVGVALGLGFVIVNFFDTLLGEQTTFW